jgi:hypothetical protein
LVRDTMPPSTPPKVKLRALDDADLEPLWKEIGRLKT